MAWPLHVTPSPSCSPVPFPHICTCANLLSCSHRCQFLFLFGSVVHVIPVGENALLPTSPRSQLKCYFVRETYPGLPLCNLAIVFFLQGIHHILYPYIYLCDYLLLSISLLYSGRNQHLCWVFFYSIFRFSTVAETQQTLTE